MAAADAIKSKETVELISNLLGKHRKPIYKDAFDLNMCLALRAGDLLNLSYTDVINSDGSVSDYLIIKEEKTEDVKGKLARKIKLTGKAKDIILKRRNQNPTHRFMFESDSNRSKGKPLTYKSLYRAFVYISTIVTDLTEEVIQFTTHSCRKTIGYFLWQQNVKIEVICALLNHSSPAVTMAYLGLVQEDVDNCYDLVGGLL